MKKFLLSAFVSLAFGVAAHAYVGDMFDDGILSYEVIEESATMNSVKVTALANVDFNGKLIIPAEVTNGGVTYRVTEIGDMSFMGSRAITGVIIPSSVTTVSRNAFRECTAITEVTIPESVTEIGMSAFKGCSSLTRVSFQNSTTVFGSTVFQNCVALTDVTLPSSLETIEQQMFWGCTSLTAIEIPSTVTKIGDYAFRDCSALQSIVIPNSVTSVSQAFMGCTGLKKVAYPSTLTNPFAGSANRVSICYPSSGAIVENGFVWGPDKSTLYFAPIGLTGEYSLPVSVARIGDNAFAHCDKLLKFSVADSGAKVEFGRDVFASSSVEEIYLGRNWSCSGAVATGISALTIGNQVTEIPACAFENAKGLESLTLGTAVVSIGMNAFSGCSLSELVFSPNVGSISAGAFRGNNLKEISLNAIVKEIGDNAFDGADALARVSIAAAVPPTANDNAFSYYGCPLYVPQGSKDAYGKAVCWSGFSINELVPAQRVDVQGNTSVMLQPGETIKLSACVYPSNASLPYIFWSSTNPAFATVDNDGNVSLAADGDAGVQAYAAEAASECKIIASTLYANGPVAEITVTDVTGGVDEVVGETSGATVCESANIYNVQGICIKRSASQHDVDTLPPGFYIINGKKVLVK